MIRRVAKLWIWGSLTLLGGSGAWGTACAPKAAGPMSIPNRALGPMTIAVAPALNFSGSTDFDPLSVADLMASELSYLEGVKVIPVSRVLAVLARQGRQEIGSPSHALEVADALGADAILVFAVTEYDPYNPPIVGLAAQLYGERREDSVGRIDPILVSRQARPFSVSARAPATFPLVQAERVFDASHRDVVDAVKAYAADRDTDGGPLGWEKYRASQRHYLRYCCHAVIRELASPGDSARVALGAER